MVVICFRCPRSQKHRGLLIQDEDRIYYNDSMDFADFNEESANDYCGFEDEYEINAPRGFSLGDFIAEGKLL